MPVPSAAFDAYRFFLQKGWNPYAAAAMAAQGVAESGYDTKVVGDAGRSIGTFQWNGPRRVGLYDFARKAGADPHGLNTQLGYADWELRNTEKRAGNALRNAADPLSAAKAAIGFERPSGWSAANPMGGMHFSKRYNAMLDILKNAGVNNLPGPMAGGPAGGSPGSGSSGSSLPPATQDRPLTLADLQSLMPPRRQGLLSMLLFGNKGLEGMLPESVQERGLLGSLLNQLASPSSLGEGPAAAEASSTSPPPASMIDAPPRSGETMAPMRGRVPLPPRRPPILPLPTPASSPQPRDPFSVKPLANDWNAGPFMGQIPGSQVDTGAGMPIGGIDPLRAMFG